MRMHDGLLPSKGFKKLKKKKNFGEERKSQLEKATQIEMSSTIL